MTAGTMIGETDIIFKRDHRLEHYIAGTDVFILKLEADVFKEILN